MWVAVPVQADAPAVPPAADWAAWRSYTEQLPACGRARSLDDYSENPKIVSAATQQIRVHAYVECHAALKNAHARVGVLRVNNLLLGRACVVYALTNSNAGILADCN